MITDPEERRNYLKYLFRRRSELLLLPFKIIDFLAGYLLRRISPLSKAIIKTTQRIIYPETRLTIRREWDAGKNNLDLSRFPEVKIRSMGDQEFTEIRLAATTIPAETKLDWQAAFPDLEDCLALHRFGWLLSALISNPSMRLAEKGLTWLSDWIQEMGQPGDSPAWESYSVAERLSNWPFILALLARLTPIPASFWQAMENSLITQMDYLSANLEFRGRFTNNHLLNDARGLYIAGVLLGSGLAMEKAKGIFSQWTPRIFSDDGMLKENSSHYQYLLCQRYEQVYFLARQAGEGQFREFMEHWLGLIRKSADFFSVSSSEGKWDLPRFGDLSPDFSPAWLAPEAAGAWTELKRLLGWLDLPESHSEKPRALEIRKGGFIRYNLGDVVLFWHLDADGSTFLSHGHYDLGSCVLFYRGKPLVVDPGRYSYAAAGSYGRRAKAHSSLLIDTLGARCEDHRLNSLQAYGRPRVTYQLTESAQEFVLEMETDGFRRLRTPVAWQRKFVVRPNQIVIADTLESSGKNQVETRFQVDSGFQVQEVKDGFVITSAARPPLELRIGAAESCRRVLLSGGAQGEEGWVSKEYGQRSAGTTILLQRELQRRQVHLYEIIWQ